MASSPQRQKGLVITIDGPSGAGKSTVARGLAMRLHYRYIDTGAMYRGIAYAFKTRYPIDYKDKARLADTIDAFLKDLQDLQIGFEFNETGRVLLDGKDISAHIRDEETALLASALSQRPEVREYLKLRQKEEGREGGVVLEGRDTGSVIFPDADIKFYLDAAIEERAKRRYLELASKGITSGLSKVREEISKRDADDSKRAIAPLIVPEGAIIVDTTGIDPEGVINILMKFVMERP